MKKGDKISISIREIRESLEKIVAHMEERGLTELELDEDYYWHTPKNVRYNVYTFPSEGQLDMGQLTDHVFEIKRIAHGEADALGFALTWLAPILEHLGEKYPL